MFRSPRSQALVAVLIFALLIGLYVREFSVFSNTLEAKSLMLGSMLAGALITGGILWRFRDRFTPWERHFPGVIFIMVFGVLFSPLFGSLLNRGLGTSTAQSFTFVGETAYYASGYGILKGEKLRPTGWRLVVREGAHEHHLRYKTQAYFPLTKPGEQVLLPVRKGLFGVRVVWLGI